MVYRPKSFIQSCFVRRRWHRYRPALVLASSVHTSPGTGLHIETLHLVHVHLYRMCEHVVAPHVTIHSLLNQTKCTWAPTERHCSPMEAVPVGRSAASWAWAPLGYLRCIHVVWTLTVITKADALVNLKEVSSCSEDATRCIDLVHAPSA